MGEALELSYNIDGKEAPKVQLTKGWEGSEVHFSGRSTSCVSC